MKKKRNERREFTKDFKLKLLQELYEEGLSEHFMEKKYNLSHGSFFRWKKDFALDIKSLSLSEKALERTMTKQKTHPNDNESLTEAERLKIENERLRMALEYAELRNEAYLDLINIGKDEFGIDLLKKDGAKQ